MSDPKPTEPVEASDAAGGEEKLSKKYVCLVVL